MKKTIKLLITISLIFALSLMPCISANAAEVGESAEQMSDSNVFSRLFYLATSHATEILCTFTLIGSLVLAYAYKKGLVPLLRKTLLSIGTSVNKIKEKTESSELVTSRFGEEITKMLTNTDALVKKLGERLDEMSTTLNEVKEKEQQKEKNSESLAVIVGAQIDMLYDIFMSSALPQYQKDAIGERVAKMKEALRKDGKE